MSLAWRKAGRGMPRGIPVQDILQVAANHAPLMIGMNDHASAHQKKGRGSAFRSRFHQDRGRATRAPRRELRGQTRATLGQHALPQIELGMESVTSPETLTTENLILPWLKARSLRRRMVPSPAFVPLSAFRRLRSVVGETGGLSWSDWLPASTSVIARS